MTHIYLLWENLSTLETLPWIKVNQWRYFPLTKLGLLYRQMMEIVELQQEYMFGNKNTSHLCSLYRAN